jgi:RimJ/RimL family protein N-acetyltransferase
VIDFGCGVQLKSVDEIALDQQRDWRNDYLVRKWTRQNDVLSYWDQNAWKERLEHDKSIKMYSIFEPKFGEGIGVCGFTGIDLVNRRAEFSLYIAPALQRQGHGKKALKTLISHGFNGFQVIWGESFAHNPATQMFIDLGFSKEGVRRDFYFRDGRFVDAHLFSILRSEWEKSEQFDGHRDQVCFT